MRILNEASKLDYEGNIGSITFEGHVSWNRTAAQCSKSTETGLRVGTWEIRILFVAPKASSLLNARDTDTTSVGDLLLGDVIFVCFV